MDYDIKKIPKLSRKLGEIDTRGFLIEFLKYKELKNQHKKFAQIYLATIAPNTIRGNHYHEGKEEYFVTMSGKALIILEDINTKERKEIVADSSQDHITRVRYGPNVAHAIKNISNETLFVTVYTTKVYNPLDEKSYNLI